MLLLLFSLLELGFITYFTQTTELRGVHKKSLSGIVGCFSFCCTEVFEFGVLASVLWDHGQEAVPKAPGTKFPHCVF